MTVGNKLLLAILVSITLGLSAQQPPPSVSWRGVLRNTAGSPLSGASIELIGQSGHKAVSITQPDGGFVFDQLPPLRYSLSVTAGGHRFAYSQPVDLSPDGTATARDVNLTLTEQGALSLQAVATEPETTGGVALSSHAVSGLPLNKRDFSQLLLRRPAP